MPAQEQRVERRLAAIFAADVAGYSRLMSQDETGTLRALTAHREIMDRLIADHGGRIANTAGDSVLAEFPSAVDAVQCAVTVQEKLAEADAGVPENRALRFRVGVHVGDVMVRGGDLFGDGVNIAARLQALSAPGGICVSASAHEHVRKALPLIFENLGPQKAKNIDEPIRAYAVRLHSVPEAVVMRDRELSESMKGSPRPLAPRASDGGRTPRIGVLLAALNTDSEYPSLLHAFMQRLEQLGWTDGRNARIDVRWCGPSPAAIQKNAEELVSLAPDVILAPGSASAGPLLQVTQNIPVVFTVVPDPVGAGFVESLARPGGNATGFTSFDYGLGAKWLELLKEVAPDVTRVGVLRDAAVTAGIGQWSAIQAAAPALGMQVSPINLRDAPDLQRTVADFARTGSGGLIVTSSALTVRHRDLIVLMAAEHKLPALYYAKAFVTVGGLISYGSDRLDQFRRAAGYVDRILNDEKPAALPVQAPTRFELAVNLNTAGTLGLTVPKSLLARADEVVE